MSAELTEIEYEQAVRYLHGELSPAAEAEFARWLAADSRRVDALEEMAATLFVSAGVVDVDVDRALSNVLKKNNIRVLPLETAPHRTRVRWPYNGSLLKIAAALLLVAGAGWLVRSRTAVDSQVSVSALDQQFESKRGERKSVRLPDGSSVVLSPGSRLTVAAEYGRPRRAVRLEGEGLFSVTHDADHPFSVMVGSTAVEDLGTEFSVRQFPHDSGARVAVRSGSVAVRVADRVVELHQSDAMFAANAGSTVVERGIDIGRYMAFADGKLVFADTPVRQVLSELGRWYDVSFDAAEGKYLTRRLSVTFDKESLDAALNTLEIQFGIRFERNGAVFKVSESASGASTKSRAGGGA